MYGMPLFSTKRADVVVGLRIGGALAEDDQRTLGAAQHVERTLDGGRRRELRRRRIDHLDQRTAAGLGLHHLAEQLARQVEIHAARPARHRGADRARDADADIGRMQHAERRLAQRLGDGELVHLLVVALLQVDDLAFGRAADQDHRKAVRRRIGERHQAVQEARRRDREAHARRLCQPPRDRRRIAGVLLVPERDHPHPLGLRQTAQIGDRDARDVIDRLDAVQLQRVDDQVEPVRQFGFGFGDTLLKCCVGVVVDMLFSLCVLPASFVVRAGHPVEKIAVLLDMRRQPHRVLAHQPFGRGPRRAAPAPR